MLGTNSWCQFSWGGECVIKNKLPTIPELKYKLTLCIGVFLWEDLDQDL